MAGSVNKVFLDQVREMYEVQCLSAPKIAAALSIGISATRSLILQAGIKMRSRGDGVRLVSEELSAKKLGKPHPHSEAAKAAMSASHLKRWECRSKGTARKPNGYIEYTTGQHKGRSVHVVHVEGRIGRRLLPNEVVHHDDEDRGNNSDENLILMTSSEHTRLHRLRDQARGHERARNSNGTFAGKVQ